jgi:hypothetical protein
MHNSALKQRAQKTAGRSFEEIAAEQQKGAA